MVHCHLPANPGDSSERGAAAHHQLSLRVARAGEGERRGEPAWAERPVLALAVGPGNAIRLVPEQKLAGTC